MIVTSLIVLFITLAKVNCSNSLIVYCVKSNDSQQCDDVKCKLAADCATLNHFSQAVDSSQYFKPFTHFVFLPGYHNHSNRLTINNTSNMTFSGLNDSRPVVINCTKPNVGFQFHNFKGVVIEYLTITNCGQLFKPHYSENSLANTTQAALIFDMGWDITLKNITISNSPTQGFYINRVEGLINITSSTFQLAVNESIGQSDIIAGNSIFSANCSSHGSRAYIKESFFTNNSNIVHGEKCSRLAAGLVIVLKCTNFEVTIDTVIFNGNKGCAGGNLALIFFNTIKPFTKSLLIDNSEFQNGYAVLGAGIYVSFIEAANNFTVDCTSSVVNNPRDILKMTNTRFIYNKAKSNGGAVFLRLKNSLTSCIDGSKVTFDNCTFQGNTQSGYGGVAIHSVNYVSFRYIKQLLPQFALSITNSIFYENQVTNTYTGSGSGVISVKDNYHVYISDVKIYNNTNCSGLLAIGSNLIFAGEINIHHNNASSGGGMLLCSDAIMFLQPYAQLIIINNHAVHTGGGICVEERCLISPPICFFQLDLNVTVNPALISSINITLADNKAEHAGDQLFGGSVDYCYLIDSPYHNQTTNSSLSVYNTTFHISPNSSSMVSSPERQVCLCTGSKNSIKNCTRSHVLSISVYPGQMFQIHAVMVGQLNGTLPGTVVAKLMNDHGQHLDQSDTVQNINSSDCTMLTYTIMSPTISNDVILKLEAKFVGDVSFADRLKLFEPLLLTVSFKKCPIGFSLNRKTGKCECLSRLQQVVHCEIQNNSLLFTKDNYWIGYDHIRHTILYSFGYSFDYCYPRGMVINISDHKSQNTQCRHQRVGVLCGSCSKGYSVVLGSSKCKNDCKDHHLLLIPVFGIIGLILVVFIIVLNMTVTVGTINGLIFYANVVQISNTQYFQTTITGITTILRVFIAWINLDLGITTCLYKGMDDYTKAWLQFIFPLYIWIILGLIVYLSRRFSFASVLIGKNGVKVLATLMLLSYSKMLRAAIATAHIKFIHHVPRNGLHDHIHICWISDCNIPGLKGKHIPLFVAGLAVGLVLIPFTFVLLFIRHLNKISNWRFFGWVWRLKPLFDAYTGPFTDKARCWTGVLCFIRLILYIISTLSSSGLVSLSVAFSNIAAVCLLFFGWLARTRIYKRKWLHILESSFILNLGILSIGTLYFGYNDYDNICCALTHISVGVAFIMFLGIVGYHIHIQLNVGQFCQCLKLIKKITSSNSKGYVVHNDTTVSDESMDDIFHNIERRHLLPKLS